MWPLAAVAVGLVIVGGALGIVLTRGSAKPALTAPIQWSSLPGLQTINPPWPNNSASLGARLQGIGLSPNTGGTLAYHDHAHVDLFVDGKRVPVPKDVGIHIDPQSQQSSYDTPLHTHDSSGIIHVEPTQNLRFVLGQFFGEWGVRLTRTCLGNFKGGCDNLHVWVNGKKYTGNPAKIDLKNHEEIVITVGTPPKKIPSSFDFGAHGV